jgi:hypothetical protein
MQFGGSGATSGRQGQWFLHHDNAQSHTSLVVQQFLLLPNHYTLRMTLAVPYSENGPQGNLFASLEDIKSNATAELLNIPNEAFHRCLQQWRAHEYFEGD